MRRSEWISFGHSSLECRPASRERLEARAWVHGGSGELWWQVEHVSLTVCGHWSGHCWSLIVIGLRNIRFEELRASISRGRGERQRSDGSGIILRFCVAARSNFQTRVAQHRDTLVCKEQQTTDMALCPVVLCPSNTSQHSHRSRNFLITWSWNGWEWSKSNCWSWKYINI